MQELQDPFTLLARAKSFVRRAKRRLVSVCDRRWQNPTGAAYPVAEPVLGITRWCTTRPSRHALVVYLPEPLRHLPETSSHSNSSQSIQIVSSLNELGFAVDVIDWRDDRFEPRQQYDLIFGEHANYGRLLDRVSDRAIRLFYGTRDYWRFEQDAVSSRLTNLRSRRRLPSHWGYQPGGYAIYDNRWVERSDAVIVIGNRFTAKTFGHTGKPVFPIDNTVCPGLPLEQMSHNARSRSNFLWVNSGTLVHKGLDLALEVFASNPQIHLWICGPLWDESRFMRIYRRELFKCPNVHPLGFIPVTSRDFATLASCCTFVLGTSCAEGMTGSVLNAMAYGLIPIVTRECGIDTEDIGMTLRESTVSGLRDGVIAAVDWSQDECAVRTRRTLEAVAVRYKPEGFAPQFRAAMSQALAVGEARRAITT